MVLSTSSFSSSFSRERGRSGGTWSSRVFFFSFSSLPLLLAISTLFFLLLLSGEEGLAPTPYGVLAEKNKKKEGAGSEKEKKEEKDTKKKEDEKDEDEAEKQRLLRASLPKRKKKHYFDWHRLSPETTVLLSSTPSQVELLNQALPFHIANVTLEEHKIAPMSFIDKSLQSRLQANSTYGVKTLRTSVVFMSDQPILLDNSRPARGAICKEGQRAMLVSFESVRREEDGFAYAHLNLHSPSVTSFHRELPGEFQLKALNPFMWSNHFPTENEFMNFRGTAICMKEGSRLQLLKGWPVTVPDYKEGPWKARVKVVRAFVTPSADMKKKNMYLLQATLHVTHQPKDGMFRDQNLDVIPFMGYIKLANRQFEHLEAAVVRHRLLDKVCLLRRVEPKSQVELKCEEVDAKLADMSEMLEERPTLKKTFKKIGLFAGISLATYSIALANYLLSSIHKEIGLLDTEASLMGGTGFAAMSILYLLIATPVVGYRRNKWRKEFGAKKTEYLVKVVEEENKLASGSAPAVDLVFVVNELQHEEEQQAAAASVDKEKKGASNALPSPPPHEETKKGKETSSSSSGTVNTKGEEDELKTSTSSSSSKEEGKGLLATKIQEVIDHHEYYNAVSDAYEGFTEDITQYREAEKEEKKEAKLLGSFLKKTVRFHPEIIDLDEATGKFRYTLDQLKGTYTYLMTQLKEERERAIPLGPYTATEVLIWRRRVSLLHRKLKELESQIKAERGDVTPPDESASVKSLKKKLKDLQESEDLLEEALSEAEGGSQQEKELHFLREQLPKALEAISEDLRMILDEDLGLLLEELDNLKSKYRETQKAAGEEPSAEQEAEMKDTRDKIKKINEQIKKLILGMRRLDLKVDLNTVVAIERD